MTLTQLDSQARSFRLLILLAAAAVALVMGLGSPDTVATQPAVAPSSATPGPSGDLGVAPSGGPAPGVTLPSPTYGPQDVVPGGRFWRDMAADRARGIVRSGSPSWSGEASLDLGTGDVPCEARECGE